MTGRSSHPHAFPIAQISITSRQLGGAFVGTIAGLVLFSALLVNPAVGKLTKGPLIVDYADVLLGYFLWAMGVGIALLWLARRIRRAPGWADRVAVLVVLLGGVVLADRFLLTRFGLPLWKYDAEIRYRHRESTVRTLASQGRPNDHAIINRWGFHDTEFPREKPKGEFRALMIGDSVTMGFGVTYVETFSSQLEGLLDAGDRRHTTHQAINAGVHGYSTFQEKVALERSLVFEPDIIFVGFCMNDVTEPFVVDVELGGTGLDYHGVSQTPNPVMGWLGNETGVGRLMQALAARGKTRELEARIEIYSVATMVQESHTSPKMREAWNILLPQMTGLYQGAKTRGIPVVLLIFPYSFQLLDDKFRDPQRILIEHAAQNGVDVIDTTDAFARLVFDDPGLVEYLRGRGKSSEEIYAYHEHQVRKYFFDHDHFNEAGHQVVAKLIYDYLAGHEFIDATPPAGRSD